MLCYIEIDDPATVVSKDNEHEQHAQSRRGNGEEVDRHRYHGCAASGTCSTTAKSARAASVDTSPPLTSRDQSRAFEVRRQYEVSPRWDWLATCAE